ncbi:HEAT repeat domain-containing protein [bacterium]|nr:HEAT repeat domain-containing protein [bacterium]
MVNIASFIRLAPEIALVMLTVGCASLGSLRERRYAEVTPEQIHRAGETDDSQLAPPLRGMLEDRLDPGGTDVTDAQAIEAVIALGKVGSAKDAAVVERMLSDDPSEDVRYFSVDALAALDPDGFSTRAERLLEEEGSALVRERISELMTP